MKRKKGADVIIMPKRRVAFLLRFSPQQQILRFLNKISRIRPLDQPGLQSSKGKFLPLTLTQRPSPERRQAPKKRLNLSSSLLQCSILLRSWPMKIIEDCPHKDSRRIVLALDVIQKPRRAQGQKIPWDPWG